MGAQSCQKPKTYFDPAANANAELSTKFNLMLCVSRFAHYLKVMARDKIGSFMEVGDCEHWLNDWISNYVVSNPESAGERTKAEKPLSEAQIEVREVKGKPGWYEAVAYLRPHFQLEALHGLDATGRRGAQEALSGTGEAIHPSVVTRGSVNRTDDCRLATWISPGRDVEREGFGQSFLCQGRKGYDRPAGRAVLTRVPRRGSGPLAGPCCDRPPSPVPPESWTAPQRSIPWQWTCSSKSPP